MLDFNVDQAPLWGRQWVEASAGSGKTWSIAGLYIRLLLAKKLKVENILVVTFTNAACAELKERLRDRILDELAKRPDESDEWLSLKLAEVNFDQARVLTIHGFCQMLLKEYAFTAGANFEWEVVNNEENLKESLAQDFWRKKMAEASWPWASWCQKNLPGPQELWKPSWQKRNKKIKGGPPSPQDQKEQVAVEDGGRPDPSVLAQEIEMAEEKFTSLWWQLKASWPKVHSELQGILKDPSLNKNSASAMKRVLAAYHVLFDAPQPQATAIEEAERLFPDQVRGAANKNKVAPQHDAFAKLKEIHEAQKHLDKMFDAKREAWLDEFDRNVCLELPRLMEQQGTKSYDELLRGVRRVLQDDEQASSLRASLHKRFFAVLMDECQDTDALQFQIFHILYPPRDRSENEWGNMPEGVLEVPSTASSTTDTSAGASIGPLEDPPVYLVGDPKQSIYEFRGANVAAYLQEAESCAGHHTLRQNFRSSPKLIAALNALFKEDSFCTPGIQYHSAIPSGKIEDGAIKQNNQAWPAMRVWLVGKESSPEILGINETKHLLYRASAAAISGWLTSGITLNGQPLKAQDIAILVNANYEADLMRQALTHLNIPCATRGTTKVTQTEEAKQWQRLLLALANPADQSLCRSARATLFLGCTAAGLAADSLATEAGTPLAADDVALYELAQILSRGGVLALWRALMARAAVMERVLAEGEHCYVNLQHLAELLEDHSKTAGRDAAVLAHWLADSPESEDFNLRLSSDENLLSIFTIHGAKGLEFPIVLCPFAWHAKDGGPDRQNDFAENMRKLYVALTRAQHHCVLVWGSIKYCHQSPLGHLLHGVRQTPPTLAEARQSLEQWQKKSGEAVLIEAVPEPRADKLQVSRRHLVMPAAISLARKNPSFWLNSFTSLSRLLGSGRLDTNLSAGVPDANHQGEKTETDCRQDFPRGAQAGSCLHELLQMLVQGRIDLDVHDGKIIHHLAAHGLERHWAESLAPWLNEVLEHPMVAQRQRNRFSCEMDFVIPIRDFEKKEHELMTDILARAMNEQWIGQGFLRGVMDLVLQDEHHRWHVVDYKSNWLPEYSNEQMKDEVHAHDYDLQGLLYALALYHQLHKVYAGQYHKFHDNFAGVHFLFIRGLDGQEATRGVFTVRPDARLMQQLADAWLRQDPLLS